jgi:hypothetical protein
MERKMKIEGNSQYVDIEYNGRTARFWGELCTFGFLAAASTMKWLPPDDGEPITDDEKIAVIKAVRKYCRWLRYKVVFADDKGKIIRRRIG